jgi:diguanylate cyclase (GGDEF)-like protein
MAEKDALTGLWNRRRSDAELSAILGVSPGRRPPTCIALLDLDHFKRINDRFSHAAGDDVLCRVADVLRATAAHVGRHGGEEFVLIMSAELTTAAQVCEAIRATLSAYGWQAVADGLRVTVSIGLTDLRPEDDAHSVMRRADDLLYAAKRGGRDRVVVG